jgi:anti-anti-sigma factor
MAPVANPSVLVFPVEVTNESLAALEQEAARVLGPESTSLVVNLARTTFLSSAALGLLVRWGKRLAERGGALALVHPLPPVQRLLRAIGLDVILPWFPTVESAAAHLAKGAAAR